MATFIISIKPKFIKMILQGSKTVELRKRNARIPPGSRALLYSTSPSCAVVGETRIVFRELLSIEQLWSRHRSHIGIERSEFDEYYSEASEGVALGFADVCQYTAPVTLPMMRAFSAGFRPPQSYMNISSAIEDFVIRQGRTGGR